MHLTGSPFLIDLVIVQRSNAWFNGGRVVSGMVICVPEGRLSNGAPAIAEITATSKDPSVEV
jgi:hypothetical protein